MSQCEARVVAVAGSDVWVEVPGRAPTCGNCKTADACQTGLLGLNTGPRRYRLENRIGAQVGGVQSLATPGVGGVGAHIAARALASLPKRITQKL